VTPLELFFDLVFVFGFTQVTTLLSDNPTWSELGHALLVLVAFWLAWAAYAWLTNSVDPVAVMQVALYALSARGDRALFKAILGSAPSAVAGAALIVAAGFVHGGAQRLPVSAS
jgi:low temperature requirement protein LtrA